MFRGNKIRNVGKSHQDSVRHFRTDSEQFSCPLLRAYRFSGSGDTGNPITGTMAEAQVSCKRDLANLTPGLTEVRSYAAFFISFLAEGLRVRFRAIPALKNRVGRPSLHAAAAVGPSLVVGLNRHLRGVEPGPVPRGAALVQSLEMEVMGGRAAPTLA